MQDADLFMELAAIAGVFVGFGALIAVRSGGPSEQREVAQMRSIVAFGVLTVVAALAPVTLSRFDLAEHQVWALSSALFLAGLFGLLIVVLRTPEYRALVAQEAEAVRTPSGQRWLVVLQSYVLNWLYGLVVVLIPIVILLGVAPDLEAGLYFALVVLELLGAAWLLLWLVFSQRRPATA
jgi:heme/copper-type cytochrome/quinol oxidase subunit 3